MLIKRCDVEDIESCAKLFVSVYSEPPYHEAWDLPDAVAYLERFRQIEPTGCFVATANDNTIGAVFSFAYPWHARKTVCIQELFVSSEQRRKGIARQLLSQINRGEKVNAWLVAHSESDAAEFYEKMGFSVEGPYKFRHGILNT